MSFVHTQPGVQSEVYLDIEVQSGTTVSATLAGPGVVSLAVQSATSGADGQVRLTWTINVFGLYTVSGSAGGSSFNDSIDVQ